MLKGKFDISGYSDDDLKLALDFAFAMSPNRKIAGFSVKNIHDCSVHETAVKTIVFYDMFASKEKQNNEFSVDEVFGVFRKWLNENECPDQVNPPLTKPYIKGFRIFDNADMRLIQEEGVLFLLQPFSC